MVLTDAIVARINKSDPVRSSSYGVGLGTLMRDVELLHAGYDPARILRVSQLANASPEDGSSWENAFRTFEKAIDYARFINHVSGDIDYSDTHHFYIIMAPGNYSAEDAQLKFSAKNVHIIGLGIPGTDTGVTIAPSPTSSFALGGSGSGIELANLCIVVDAAAAGLWWEYIDSCWFHDLVIGDFQTVNQMTYGIYTEGLNNSIIENCRIACPVTGGIHIAGSVAEDRYLYNSIIRNNTISAVQTCDAAIYVGANVTGTMLITRNFIIGDNFTKSIDVDHLAANVMVAENFVHSAGEGGTIRGEVSS